MTRIEHLVCYGLADRITFANGKWLGADIPEEKRKPQDALSCPLAWEFLNDAGIEAWELVTVLESQGNKGALVRTYFLKRQMPA